MSDILSRAEFEVQVRLSSYRGREDAEQKILAHDAALRADLEQAQARVRELTEKVQQHQDAIEIVRASRDILFNTFVIWQVEYQEGKMAKRREPDLIAERDALAKGLEDISLMDQEPLRAAIKTGDQLQMIAGLTKLFNQCRDHAHAVLRDRRVNISERDALKAQVTPPLRWTTEKPTVPGWYWWIDVQVPHNTMLPVIVYVAHDLQIRALTLKVDGQNVACIGGKFAGPLPLPEPEEGA